MAGAVGPEFDEEGAVHLCAELTNRWPGGSVEPLWVLGRALGVLVTTDRGGSELAELARFVAPFFELASGFTDVFERGRRRKQPSPAAEMQLELLPPRIARVAGGQLVASVLPAYDVGGDWFDHAENPEGVWLAIGDAMGKGIRAAAMSAVSIGALRSARRAGGDAQRCSQEMHRAIIDFGINGFVTAIVGFWHATTSMFTWTNCGHLSPLLVRAVSSASSSARRPIRSGSSSASGTCRAPRSNWSPATGCSSIPTALSSRECRMVRASASAAWSSSSWSRRAGRPRWRSPRSSAPSWTPRPARSVTTLRSCFSRSTDGPASREVGPTVRTHDASGLSSPLGLRREVPATAMRTRVRAPLAAAPSPSQVAVEPNAPQRPLGSGGRAVSDLLLAGLQVPQRPSYGGLPSSRTA